MAVHLLWYSSPLDCAFWQSSIVKRLARGPLSGHSRYHGAVRPSALWFAIREMDVPRFELAVWGGRWISRSGNIIVVIE